MTKLNSVQILQEKKTHDPNSISTLTLTHKALSDVSCLVDFRNLEKLDLGFNNLSSLEGLKACVNIKWLSVIQNKLQSLKGIEGLSKLTVLNAGKNKLRSMDEVNSCVRLRALILNDNEIISICKLNQLTELNTLVLSKNPVCKIGKALDKVKSLTKLSLSHCQLQTIGSSLKSCNELKELRLAHNEIKTLPAELNHNARLHNLDLGSNFITSWSDVEVLKSFAHLRNLNLQGNPIADNDKLAKKIKKLVPNLQIFNAKPIDKTKDEKRHGIDTFDDSSLNVANDFGVLKPEENNHFAINKIPEYRGKSQGKDANTEELDMDKKSKRKKRKTDNGISGKEISVHKEDNKKGSEGKTSKKLTGGELDVIDDGETPFAELFCISDAGHPKENDQMKIAGKANCSSDPTVTFPAKKKKSKSSLTGPALHELFQVVEVGMGGPSTWGD